MPENPEIIVALLRQRTPVSFRAGGPSMNPAIRDGDVISVRGKGKGTVSDTGGRSRKDRIFVTAERRV